MSRCGALIKYGVIFKNNLMNTCGLDMSIKMSKYLWFFSGIWVLLGALVSAAALLGGTVGDLLGLKDILINLNSYLSS